MHYEQNSMSLNAAQKINRYLAKLPFTESWMKLLRDAESPLIIVRPS